MPDSNIQLIDKIWVTAVDLQADTNRGTTVETLAAAVDASVPVVIEALQCHPILSNVLSIGFSGQVIVKDLPGIDITACRSLDAIARRLFEVTRQRLLDIEATKLARLDTTCDDADESVNMPRKN